MSSLSGDPAPGPVLFCGGRGLFRFWGVFPDPIRNPPQPSSGESLIVATNKLSDPGGAADDPPVTDKTPASHSLRHGREKGTGRPARSLAESSPTIPRLGTGHSGREAPGSCSYGTRAGYPVQFRRDAELGRSRARFRLLSRPPRRVDPRRQVAERGTPERSPHQTFGPADQTSKAQTTRTSPNRIDEEPLEGRRTPRSRTKGRLT